MKTEHILYRLMVENGMKIVPGTLDSLRESLEEGNIRFFLTKVK